MRYLLDTNVFVDLLRYDNESIKKGLAAVGLGDCCISDLTKYELMVGAIYHRNPEMERARVAEICGMFKILPCSEYLDAVIRQKEYLKNTGRMIPDFDIFIGTTAIENELTIVSSDSHMMFLRNAIVEDWKKIY